MNNYRSEQINDLATALSKAQAEFSIAGLNKNNPFFKSKYADYKSIVEAARPALTKYGLAVSQCVLPDQDGNNVLHTILLHSSGQFLESQMKINPVKSDIQSVSSYITYIKRVTFASLVGVLTGEEDDDGEAAVSYERNHKPQETLRVTPEQLEQLYHELDGYPTIAQKVMKGLNIQGLSDMPRESFIRNINRIKELVTEEKSKR